MCVLLYSGCWDEEVVQMVLKYLVMGNTEVRQDLIKTMIDGKNVQYVNKVWNLPFDMLFISVPPLS